MTPSLFSSSTSKSNVSPASVVNAGSSVLVAGSAVYGHPEGVAEAIRRLRLAASEETA